MKESSAVRLTKQSSATQLPEKSAAAARRPLQLGRLVPYAIAIFFLSLVVRLLHLWQIRPAPFFELLMGDAQSYHVWAQQIASGDVIGSDVFYQAPLYPYFLGLVYAVLGDGPLIVRLCQAVLGSLACVLLAFAGWQLFTKRVGIVAGVMLALYAPAIFFDGLIQKPALAAFLLCLLLALLSRLMVQPDRRWAWLGVGLTLGCLVLLRENTMVFVGAIVLWLLWYQRHRARQRFVLVGFLAAGLAIVLLPVATRNKVVSGEFYLTTSQFGPNFYIGNNESSSGVYEPLRFGHGDPKFERQDATELAEQATGTRLTPGGVSRYWTWRTLDYIRTQPGDWLQLMGRKLMLAWNAAEVADTEDQLSYAEWSFLLRASGHVWHFGVLAPLALFGVWVTWPRRADLTLLYLLLASYVVALVGFAVLARYRYPLVPFLILFASAGAVNLGQLLRARPRQPLVWAAAATLVLAVVSNWPIYSMAEMRAVTDSNVGTELQAQGRLDEAIVLYRDALARDAVDAVAYSNLGTALAANGELGEAITQYQRALDLAPNDADSHYNLANVLSAQGRFADAASQFRVALRIDPSLAEAHVNLGNALVALGQLEDAAGHYRRGTELAPDAVEPLNNLGLLVVGQGAFDEAIPLFRQALAIAPDFADAHTNLASALQQTGAVDEALTHFRRAAELLPESASAQNDLGMALGDQQALDEATALFRRAIEIDRTFTDAYSNLAMVFQLQGQPAEAIAQYRAILEIAPGLASAHFDLGNMLVQQNELDDAVDHFRQAIAIAPDFAQGHFNLATALQIQGNLDDAIRHYREAARIAPGTPEIESRLQAALAER